MDGLNEQSIVAPLPWLGLLEVTGEDRATWLQGMITQDVVQLAPWHGRYGCVIDLKGRVIADFQVFNDIARGRLLLEIPRARAEALIEHLEGRLVAEDAELRFLDDLRVITVQGPESQALQMSDSDLVEHVVAGHEVVAGRRSHTGMAGFDLFVPERRAAEIQRALVEAGFSRAGEEALEALRIAAAIPRYGADFDDTVMPLEAGLLDAIHWGKGCYLGQEVLARLAHRGHTNKELRQLRLEGDQVPSPGAEVWPDEEARRPTGRVTSASMGPGREHVYALAYLRRKYFEPGTPLIIRDGDAELKAVVTARRVREHAPLLPENDPGYQAGNKAHRGLL